MLDPKWSYDWVVAVDEKELKTSVNWLISKRLPSGCFPEIETLLNQDLKVLHCCILII